MNAVVQLNRDSLSLNETHSGTHKNLERQILTVRKRHKEIDTHTLRHTHTHTDTHTHIHSREKVETILVSFQSFELGSLVRRRGY